MEFLTIGDPRFPQNLKDIKPKVDKLFFKKEGLDKDIFEKCIAIVGSRRMTNYGKDVLGKIVPELVEAGITIVSGFMYGVDQEAHRLVLEYGGKAIAVLGWGIDWNVGDDDIKLYRKIEKEGLIISEYGENTKPQLWMFPKRNRIVAGISQATLIVEAAEGSGSLVTADWAIKYKRKLFAIPGPITSKVSKGANDLIRSGQAEMATSALDILKSLGWQVSETFRRSNPAGFNPAKDFQDRILLLLENEGLVVDEIAIKLNVSIEKVGVELSFMQLEGKVREVDGKFFVVQ